MHIFCKPAGTTRKTFTFRDLFKTFYGKSVLSAMHNLSFLTWKNSIIFSFLKQKNKENFSSIHCNKIFGNVRSKEIQIVLRLFLVIATYVLSSQFKPVQSTIQPPTLLKLNYRKKILISFRTQFPSLGNFINKKVGFRKN